jgi:hypothetical protein
MLFHVLNRGVGRMNLFSKDYEAFEGLLEEGRQGSGPFYLGRFHSSRREDSFFQRYPFAEKNEI